MRIAKNSRIARFSSLAPASVPRDVETSIENSKRGTGERAIAHKFSYIIYRLTREDDILCVIMHNSHSTRARFDYINQALSLIVSENPSKITVNYIIDKFANGMNKQP
jgi:hypothetical protein